VTGPQSRRVGQSRRPGRALRAVLAVLIAERGHVSYGSRIGRLAGLESSTVVATLARLKRQGWAWSWWENPENAESGPQRHFFQLTEAGLRYAQTVLDPAAEVAGAGSQPSRPVRLRVAIRAAVAQAGQAGAGVAVVVIERGGPAVFVRLADPTASRELLDALNEALGSPLTDPAAHPRRHGW
jgi:DNA-binding PadR family transcriptional regulator